MRRIPRITIPSLLSSLSALACSPDPEVCEAFGQSILDLPAPSSRGIDCSDLGWLADVEPLSAELSVELAPAAVDSQALLRWHPDGPIAAIDDELIGFDRDGNERWRVDYAPNFRLDLPRFRVGGDGRIYVADSFGNDSMKVVIRDGSSGQQLDQFIVQDVQFAIVSPLLLTDDALWLARKTPEGFDMQRYTLDGDGPEAEFVFAQSTFDQPSDLAITPSGVMIKISGDDASIARLDLDAGDYPWVDRSESELYGATMVVDGEDIVVATTNYSGEPSWSVVRLPPATGEPRWHTRFGVAAGGLVGLDVLPDQHLAFSSDERIDSGSGRAIPAIAILDGEGTIVAGQHLAVLGAASSVAVGPSGDLFVIGDARVRISGTTDFDQRSWLRRYAW